MTGLHGKVAVVIGASSRGGLGESVAIDLAARGARVVVSGRNADRCAALAERIGGTAIACDIDDEAQIEALMIRAAETGGGIDIVVNAAGLPIPAMLSETTRAMLDRTVATNLIGPVLCMRHAAANMPRGGVFIQFSSIAVRQPAAGTVTYAVAKAGAEMALRIAALEYGAERIRFVGVAPTVIFTPMTEFMNTPEVRAAVESITPLGRMATPDDVTALVRYLASDECFETGEVYPVTGGAINTRALTAADFGLA